MRINVKAKPGAREEKVEKLDEFNFVVSVKEPPIQGMANRAIIRVLQEYFHTLNVRIVLGHISRNKVIEVL